MTKDRMVSSLMTVDLSEMNNLSFGKGPFFNYVDQILPIIDHLPTPSWRYVD